MSVNSQASKILLIGPEAQAEPDWGAISVPNWEDALEALKELRFSVVGFGHCGKLSPTEISREIYRLQPDAIQILVTLGLEAKEALGVINEGRIFRLVPSFADPLLPKVLPEAIESFNQNQQELDLLRLTSDQSTHLKSMTEDLEGFIQKRQEDLRSSAQKLSLANSQASLLHTSLINIYRARSVGEMEALLTRVVVQAMSLTWLKLVFHAQTNLSSADLSSSGLSLYRVPLSDAQQQIGELIFARPARASFSRGEKAFLTQIAEAVVLAIGRLGQLEQSETLKRQWEATFDAISTPLCLTDRELRIIKTNLAFAHICRMEFRQLVGKNALHTFFGESAADLAASGEMRSLNRIVEGQAHNFEVRTQELGPDPSQGEPLFLVKFEDITQRLELERQMIEASKMAEIGTIGSSIAHELNNPLAGMLSFVQLARMNVPSADPVDKDLAEIEAAIKKCRDIIQSLLGFARRQGDGEKTTLNFKDTIDQAVKLTELISRSKGIQIELKLPDEPIPVHGRFNQLVQALSNILQNSVEAISVKMSKDPRFQGRIRIEAQEKGPVWSLEIEDNGIGIASEIRHLIFNPLFTTKGPGTNPGLGLTVAFKILSDHGAKLEIISHEGQGTTAIISLQRLDLPNERRDFDSKI